MFIWTSEKECESDLTKALCDASSPRLFRGWLIIKIFFLRNIIFSSDSSKRENTSYFIKHRIQTNVTTQLKLSKKSLLNHNQKKELAHTQ